MKKLLVAVAAVVTSACDGTGEDPSMNLTGTEQEAVMPPPGGGGGPTCPSSKVLVCHIPPGNPANAHSICVGPPAWPPHHRLHGDTMGACGGTTSTADAGTPPPPPPPPPVDAGSPACVPAGGACNAGVTCCDAIACNQGFCTPLIP
jgi:hypothetical protein